MSIRKKALILSSVAMCLLMVLPVGMVSAGTTTLAAPGITDKTLTPSSDFSINITVADVSEMGGYDITLRFDNSVLEATGCESYSPFLYPWPFEGPIINNEEGYVLVSYSVWVGDPGLKTVGPAPIVRVDFHVIGSGASQLDLQKTEISDIYGHPIGHVAVDGWFRNIPGIPVADFYWTPETPVRNKLVTFTSTSIDPEGYMVSWDWDFGDGKRGRTTGETITHKYNKEGTYTVALTVTDNDGNTDSFSQTITVLPKSPREVGAKLQSANCSEHLLNYTETLTVENNTFRAQVKNLNNKNDTLVRVSFFIYDGAMTPLGAIEPDWRWLKPGQSGHFTVDFKYTDWGFVGPEMEYIIVAKVYWMDYMLPTGPHWVLSREEIAFSFWVVEKAPVAVYTWTDLGNGTVLLDASASYDPDDYIVDITWKFYETTYWPYYMYAGQPTITHTPDPYGAFDYMQDEAGNWYGYYYVKLYVTDSFGATTLVKIWEWLYLPGYVPPP